MKKSISSSNPPLVTIPVLREHFRITYKLDEAQVELMIQSSQLSLEVTLSAAKEALLNDDICQQLARAAHNLKGLLLNMGEESWAQIARQIEQAAKSNEEFDYAGHIDRLCVGVAAVTGYTPE